MKFRSRDFALSGRLPVQAESLAKFFLRTRARPVNFVAQDEDGAVGQLLVCEEGVELSLGFCEPAPVAAVDEEDDGVDGGEVVAPNLRTR